MLFVQTLSPRRIVVKVVPNLHVLSKSAASSSVLKLWSQPLWESHPHT